MKNRTRKALFRKSCIKLLQKRSQKNIFRDDKRIQSILHAYIEAYRAKTIMCYLPLPIETNITPLLNRMRREGKRIYVPFMEGESFRLVKYRYPLRKKRFGVKEPKYSKQYRKKEIDIAIVPVVGVDITCRRIGFGKGMYDRFFEKEMKHIKKIVFVARKLCYTKEVVTDHHDVKADMVIVPKMTSM